MPTISPSNIPLPKLHEYLLSTIAPRPIAFVSTVDNQGNVNLSPFSFFNVFGANPPILVFSPARSGRTGATKHTHDNALATKECVVNIAHYDMLYQMNLAAGMYEKGINEFTKSGLTAVPSQLVKPPRVAESHVSFECKVLHVIETGTGGGAGNLVICEVMLLHISDHVLDAEGSIDPAKMNYIARLGKQWWCRVGQENMLQVPPFKMADKLGMGFDALPPGVRLSKILTGNDLAQLASEVRLPTKREVFDMDTLPELQQIIDQLKHDFFALEKAMHKLAQQEIAKENIWLAWKILMVAEFTRDGFK